MPDRGEVREFGVRSAGTMAEPAVACVIVTRKWGLLTLDGKESSVKPLPLLILNSGFWILPSRNEFRVTQPSFVPRLTLRLVPT
jgi:hypothetical protein